MQPPSLLAAFTLTKKHQSEHQRMVQDDCSAVLFLLRPVGKAEMSGAGVLRAFANSSFASRITGCHATDTNSIISVAEPSSHKQTEHSGPGAHSRSDVACTRRCATIRNGTLPTHRVLEYSVAQRSQLATRRASTQVHRSTRREARLRRRLGLLLGRRLRCGRRLLRSL